MPDPAAVVGSDEVQQHAFDDALILLYWTEDRPDDFCLQMAGHAGLKAGDVIAFGHTHKPWHREIAQGDGQGIHFVNSERRAHHAVSGVTPSTCEVRGAGWVNDQFGWASRVSILDRLPRLAYCHN